MFLNPFILSSLVWIFVIILYKLKISQLYPILELDLMLFCLIIIFIKFIFGIFIFRKRKIFFIGIEKNFGIRYFLLFIGFFVEFVYIGKIPLVEIILKTGYSYQDFHGIKILHVILVTYNIYLILCAFNNYIVYKKYKYIFYILIGISIYFLLYVRGYILLICICCFFIMFFYHQTLKNIIKISLMTIIFLYLFGVTGNIRHNYKWNDTIAIKQIARINIKKNMLDPFMWSYVYITSPLGNLQYNFTNTEPIYKKDIYIYENLLPDMISKRINYKEVSTKLMTRPLTVSTGYVKSYLTYGQLGMYMTFIIYTAFQLVVIKIVKNSKYYIVILSLLTTLDLLMIFSNLFILSGFSFSFVFFVIDIILEKLKNIKIKKFRYKK